MAHRMFCEIYYFINNHCRRPTLFNITQSLVILEILCGNFKFLCLSKSIYVYSNDNYYLLRYKNPELSVSGQYDHTDVDHTHTVRTKL